MTAPRFDRRTGLVLAGTGLASLLLASCKSSVSRTVWPDITFAHVQPIPMNVYDVQVIEAAGQPAVQPPAHNIRSALPVSPVETMRRWADQRIAPMGGYGTALLTITESRFVEVPLDTKTGVQGMFTTDQSERYEGLLAVRLEIVNDPNASGFVEARASGTRTVPEDYSINQREQALYDMMADIVRNLDQRLDQQIRSDLARWVVMG